MVDLFQGASYPFRAVGVLRRYPHLSRYIVIPILVNLVIGALLYTGLLIAGFGAIDRLLAETTVGTILEWVLRVVLTVALLVAVGFVLVRFGVVLGSPWYGQLSEQLERLQTGQAPPAEPLTPSGISRDLWRATSFEVKKVGLILAVGLPLLLVNLIPVVGQVVGFGGSIVLGTLLACLDFFDGPLERRRLRFRQKLAVIRRSLPASAGFGLVCLGLVSVPVISLLAIPLCVAAGTLFFCERLLDRQIT